MTNNTKRLAAVLVADLHLCQRAPLFRVDDDWLETQAGYLRQVKKLTRVNRQSFLDDNHSIADSVPLVIAGDIFDRWNTPAEVITMALRELPDKVYAIPGNHDLPNHRLDAVTKSAYGTLVAAGRIIDVLPGTPRVIEDGPTPLRLYGFPCGCPVTPLVKPSSFHIEVAVIHDYVWIEKASYPGAPPAQRASVCRKKLNGYDVAVYGDNHIGFQVEKNDCVLFNCGGFMRRKSDERLYQPGVGLLYTDGTIERRDLDTSDDKYNTEEKTDLREATIDVHSFVESLLELGDVALNFTETVHRVLETDRVDERVKATILTALSEGKRI